ncbi:MAG: PIG-L family deacetylase [Pyrinomonadaceae bacterium]|nr:PIG-L family deacetylase [Pyrinomonadaceae bacterium]
MRNRFVFAALKICAVLSLVLAVLMPVQTRAQVRPVNDYGALGLGRLLKQLNTTASVMMIGAHPDDEDSALIAYLARGENARTAYLSLTRGDGGQNIIGPELFESLGVIRTEELLQARRLDGAEQYFARAFDYGFSKTLDEAKSKWPQEVIMCDVVRAIRSFRPLVVISRFSGTPADGHGQHQYAGFISPLAVKAAGDWDQCKGAGDPWQVRKLYVEQGFSSKDKSALQLNTGRFDGVYGRSYFEIAIEGRSQHKSQGEGRIELKGDQISSLKLQGDAPEKAETTPFDGLDTTISGIARLSGSSEEPFNAKLKPLADAIAVVLAKYRPDAAQDIVGDLASIYKMAYDAEWSTRRPESKQFMEELQTKSAAAIRNAAGVQIDLLSDKETVTPGGEINATLRLYSPMANIRFQRKTITVPRGFTVTEIIPRANEQQTGPFRREEGKINDTYRINVASNAAITQPYWLTNPRLGEVFDWPDSSDLTLPFSPAAITANVTAFVGDIEIPLSQPLEYRYADVSRGELRREVNVVPPVSISLDKDLVIVPSKSVSTEYKLQARITNNTSKPISLDLSTSKQVGFAAAKLSTEKVELKPNESKNAELSFKLPSQEKNALFKVGVAATVDGVQYRSKMHTVAYPHIQTHRYYTDATARVATFDLAAEKRNIGYVMGSGDEISEAVRQMGMSVTMLEDKDLASGDLGKYDTIVVGVRATETRPDMMANKARLIDYVKNGGNLVVQYQRGGFATSGLPPFPVTTADNQRTAAGSIARVVDENAKVNILAPEHPFFTTPNKITDDDFKGWVQERNAYNLVTFDPQYTPLLESHDAGEQENKGGLVIAMVGKGNWVYCSYSFFRQLPAGVPGAYRLFANLLSMPKAAR